MVALALRRYVVALPLPPQHVMQAQGRHVTRLLLLHILDTQHDGHRAAGQRA